ncbi:MAG: hypothetical protein LBU41_00085 [Clostridiales Family XIII bacterium]|nr:hypothetical protein [Clostridiales Family XIII bacterium]
MKQQSTIEQVKRKMSVLSSCRGTAMVESSLYFPIVILCVIFAVVMMIHLYRQTAVQAKLHLSVREEVMQENENVQKQISDSDFIDRYRAAAESLPFTFAEESHYGAKYVSASTSQQYEGGRLTRAVRKRRFTGRWYLIDEELLIRVADGVAAGVSGK